MIASESKPIAASLTAKEARDVYLAENGFAASAYDDPTATISFFFFDFSLPNPPTRKRAVRLHDLHHVVTGYGTDLVGEAEISAWEMRRGFGGLGIYVSAIVFSVVVLGLVIAPRRTIRAWRRSSGKGSLFQTACSYDELLGMTVGELRSQLGVPEAGVAEGERGLHARAPRGSEWGELV